MSGWRKSLEAVKGGLGWAFRAASTEVRGQPSDWVPILTVCSSLRWNLRKIPLMLCHRPRTTIMMRIWTINITINTTTRSSKTS